MPFSVDEAFGTRSRVAVKGSVNGVEFRSSLMPQGSGTHILVVNRELRDKAGVIVGDTASFELALDTEPRVVEVPEELQRALQADGGQTSRNSGASGGEVRTDAHGGAQVKVVSGVWRFRVRHYMSTGS